MIRKATRDDIEKVAELYEKMLSYEESTTKYTSWQRGIYPTLDTARLGVKNGSLYVVEENREIIGSVILDTRQAPEYKKVDWGVRAGYNEALVIHTLCVHPDYSGSGVGSAIVDFAKQLAKQMDCRTIRLNTTDRNTPAAHLYEKNGFVVAGAQKILLNGQIPCETHLFMEFKII